MKKIVFRLILVVVSIMICATLAFAMDKSEPIFTMSSDMMDVAVELLSDGDAYINAYGSSKDEKQGALRLVQSYIDSVSSSSQTPIIKGSVIRSGQSDEQIKMILVRSDEAYTDSEMAELLSKAGNTVESINNFLVSQLSYDDSGDEISMSSASATAKGALSTGKAVCMGYANAFSVLAEQAGIRFVKVRGYIDGAYHVINVVEGGFAVDVTANDNNNNRFLMVPLADYCDAVGFRPEVSFDTVFGMKYNSDGN